MDAHAKREALRLQFLIDGDAELAAALAEVAEFFEVPKDGVLIEEGQMQHDLFLILSGSFGVFLAGGRIGTHDAGYHVGEIAMVDKGTRRSATVAALEDSIVARIPYSEFVRLADRNPKLWRGIAVGLGRRIRQMNEWMSVHLKDPNPELDEDGVDLVTR